ncbi:MAG: hypothetical protein JO272_14275 [Pseudonocardiales bacterium]|nr:hypothetical protein [Pseudonocardiales bacterium]
MSRSGAGTAHRDDLGARLLAEHPRGEQWRQLDVTVTNLTFDQLDRMARLADTPTARDRARTRLIDGLTEGELLGRLESRWVRWASTFGLPQPTPHRPPRQILRHPYTVTDDELPAAYLAGVLGIFDAGLAIAAAPIGTAEYDLLTAPWQRACLPSRFTPTTAYGPYTQPALALLRHARTLPPASVQAIRHSRTSADHDHWATARDTLEDSALHWGYPFRSQCLFWEAVPAAEDAAGQSPTDPYLADALWGAAATQAFTGRLSAQTVTVLAAPWRSAGLTLPS